MRRGLLYMMVLFLFCTCKEERTDNGNIETPFGDVTMAGTDTLPPTPIADAEYDLPDMIKAGELIVLTLEGRNTWYKYRKRSLGAEYLMAEQFASSCGIFIRCETCRDTTDMIERLLRGEGDFIAFPLPRHIIKENAHDMVSTGAKQKESSWACRRTSAQLKKALDAWYSDDIRQEVADMEQVLKMNGGFIHTHFSPVYDRRSGKISPYDMLFRRHSSICGWDWRLLTALCYQESMFDPNARSFAGARGLMQLMPATAAHVGLPIDDINDPEKNIMASCRYIKRLMDKYRHIPSEENRIKWVLAAYNGGAAHLEDAQQLALADGMTSIWSWERMKPYVKRLQDPYYYKNTSLVKHGYMRSSETLQYVTCIMNRWTQYRKVAPR